MFPRVANGCRAKAAHAFRDIGLAQNGVQFLRKPVQNGFRHAARYLKDTPPAEGSQGVFYPGELEAMREADRRANGIEIEDRTIEVLTKLAGELGVAGKLGL